MVYKCSFCDRKVERLNSCWRVVRFSLYDMNFNIIACNKHRVESFNTVTDCLQLIIARHKTTPKDVADNEASEKASSNNDNLFPA